MLEFLEVNKEITNLSWFKTKAVSRYYFEIKSEEDVLKLKKIIDFSLREKLKISFIWSGTNILFGFDFFDWIIIKNNLVWYQIVDNIIEVNSWELVSKLSKELVENYSRQFFLAWIGLPWTIGWAIIGNAWCFWLEMKDLFVSAKIANFDNGEIIELNYEQMNFDYRTSYLKTLSNYFLISAKIRIDSSLVVNEKLINEVRQKQPKGLSCGSFYKNPQDNYAGKLIENSGLKWYKIWGAYVSQVHANFLMSDTTATFEDILQLNEMIKNEVFKNYGINLKEEVVILK